VEESAPGTLEEGVEAGVGRSRGNFFEGDTDGVVFLLARSVGVFCCLSMGFNCLVGVLGPSGCPKPTGFPFGAIGWYLEGGVGCMEDP
jgi:hypothetical protein